jgi:hypothetical protein
MAPGSCDCPQELARFVLARATGDGLRFAPPILMGYAVNQHEMWGRGLPTPVPGDFST